MKHVKTFESFVNETEEFIFESAARVAMFNKNLKEISIPTGLSASSGVRCKGGKLEAYYDGMGRNYSYSLDVSCDDAEFEKMGEELAAAMTKEGGAFLGGLVSRPIDKESKKKFAELVKKIK